MRQPRRERHIAVLTDLDLSHPTFSHCWRPLATLVRRELWAQGLAARPYFGDNAPGSGLTELPCTECLEAIATDQVAAVAVLNTPPSATWFDPLRARRVPVVGTMPGHDHFVISDGVGMVRAATRRLVAARQRRLAFMRGAPQGVAPEPGDPALAELHAVLVAKGAQFHYPFPVWLMELDPDEIARLMAGLLARRLHGETPPAR